MNTMADGARDRLVAQIGEALFDQPGMTLMELAEKVKGMQAHLATTALGFPVVIDPTVAPGTYEIRQPSPAGQGDVRSLAEHITDHLCHHEYDIGGRPELLACVVDALATHQPVAQEPVTVEAVATVQRDSDGDRYIDWLTEGGIADLEAGDVLMVSDRRITDESGSGEVYAVPPAQAVDLGAMPDGWRLSKKATCYQLSHGNEIIGNLIGPDAEENAAIIARVLDSKAVGK